MLAAVAASAALLAGCAPGPLQDVVGQRAEEAIEGATGGDVNLDGGLPAGFPEEIPLIEGEISFSAGTGGTEGWVVSIEPATSGGDPVAEARAALESAGFVPEQAFEGVDLGAQVFSNGTHLVLLSGDAAAVMYTVTPVAQ
jgi:hypothetical protein